MVALCTDFKAQITLRVVHKLGGELCAHCALHSNVFPSHKLRCADGLRVFWGDLLGWVRVRATHIEES